MIDYSIRGEEAAIQLAVTLSTLSPSGGLPDPLPDPPKVPVSNLADLSQQIDAKILSIDDQLVLVGKLESALTRAETQEDQAVVLDLVHRLQQRPDLYADVERRIHRSLSSSESKRASSAGANERPPSSDQSNIELWSAQVVGQTSLWWLIHLRLTNEHHYIEYTAKGLFNRFIIDTHEKWKKTRRPSYQEYQISDGELTRTLTVNFEDPQLTKARTIVVSVDNHELLRFKWGY